MYLYITPDLSEHSYVGKGLESPTRCVAECRDMTIYLSHIKKPYSPEAGIAARNFAVIIT
jgi:hypothetical protein